MADNFVDVPFKYNNLDKYQVRKTIRQALLNVLPALSGKLLDVGCGKMPYKEFIMKNSKIESYTGLDIEGALDYHSKSLPDYTWNGITMPFADFSFNCAIATEVLEHVPDPETTLREVFRTLKVGGTFFFTVPFIWNLHEVPHDQYRYTPFSLARHLENVGFTDIVITATGGWHASLAQMLGLWVRRAPLNGYLKTIMSYLLMPVVYMLIRMDRKVDKSFREGQMITGMSGVAVKN